MKSKTKVIATTVAIGTLWLAIPIGLVYLISGLIPAAITFVVVLGLGLFTVDTHS